MEERYSSEHREYRVPTVEEITPDNMELFREAYLFLERHNFYEEMPAGEDIEQRNISDADIDDTMSTIEAEGTDEHIVAIYDSKRNIIAAGTYHWDDIDKEASTSVGRLGRVIVDPDHRGKEYERLLTEKRINILRKKECTEVRVSVSLQNPRSLLSKFKQGFVLEPGSYIQGEEYMISMKKYLDVPDSETKYNAYTRTEDISLSNIAAIQACIHAGGVGVDISYTRPDDISNTHIPERLPDRWQLIFRLP